MLSGRPFTSYQRHDTSTKVVWFRLLLSFGKWTDWQGPERPRMVEFRGEDRMFPLLLHRLSKPCVRISLEIL